MILIIKTNKESLHDLEFVKPIEKILEENKKLFKTVHYSEISKKDIISFNSIIITGTSLQDNEFIKNTNKFDWIKNYKKPLLGICAGMQIISLIHKGKLKQKTEIGFYKEKFTKNFLGIKKNSEKKVYHLHNNYAVHSKEFEEFTNSKIPTAIKHKTKEIYGTLFHPEVRNKEIIKDFINK